ncbi:MAG: hypothetical protein Q8K00_12255 [Syntrophales bacterium]|nr:hypothetical protein [Syntrophales bacterium]
MSKISYTDVFVPGGFPHYTYNPREKLRLEAKVRQATENLCKLIPVTGHTKSGKTVLVRKVLPREDALWIDGGGVGAEDDFWNVVIDQLELFQTTESETSKGRSSQLSVGAKAGANLIVAKGEAQGSATISSSQGSRSRTARTVSSKVTALAGLRKSKLPVVVDDFHYLPRGLQGELIRALKPLIFDGLPVVIIAIPHRRYDALKVEKEMTGRILPVEIPLWEEQELRYIADIGFKELGIKIPDAIIEILPRQAIGSPHLMQEFCRAIGRIHEEALHNFTLTKSLMDAVFTDTADTIGRPIFEKLARGPRQRADRIPRLLKNGQKVDIYSLVLYALAHIKPGLATLEYEDLRTAIRDVSADKIPQLQEVARVLKHMSEIAATDQSSTPVIDFSDADKQLHVTDPFFAFYLRWGRMLS